MPAAGQRISLLSRTKTNLSSKRMYKTCTKCGETKVLDLFPVAKRAKDGRDTRCKACAAKHAAKYRAANPEKCKSATAEWVAKHPEARAAIHRKWRADNIELARQRNSNWRNANWEKAREQERAYVAANREKELQRKRIYTGNNKPKWAQYATKRRASKLNATPPWADYTAIEDVYVKCAKTSAHTGVEHEVDHIVPLISPVVCGLHVACNLQVIPKFENRSKSNKFQVE